MGVDGFNLSGGEMGVGALTRGANKRFDLARSGSLVESELM